MAYKERVYQRKLKQPLAPEKKPLLARLVVERLSSSAPGGLTAAWHPTDPVMTVRARMVVFTIQFTPGEVTVECEYGWLARQILTQQMRADAHAAVHQLCDDADL
jgi:hypothetical protein